MDRKSTLTREPKAQLARSPRRLGVKMDALLAERIKKTAGALAPFGVKLEAQNARAALLALKKRAETDPRAKEFLEKLTMRELGRLEAVKENLFPQNRVPGVVYVQAKVLPGYLPKKERRQWLVKAVENGLVIPWTKVRGKQTYLIPMQGKIPAAMENQLAREDMVVHKRSFFTEPQQGTIYQIKGTGLRYFSSTEERLQSFRHAEYEKTEERQFFGGARAQTTRTAVSNARAISHEFEKAIKEKDHIVTFLSKIGDCKEAPFITPGVVFKPMQNVIYPPALQNATGFKAWAYMNGRRFSPQELRWASKKESGPYSFNSVQELITVENEYEKAPQLRLRKALDLIGIPSRFSKKQVVFGYSLKPQAVGKRIDQQFIRRDVKRVLRAYGFKEDTVENRLMVLQKFGARLLLARYLVEERLKGRLGDDESGWPISTFNATPTHFTDLDSVELGHGDPKNKEASFAVGIETMKRLARNLGLSEETAKNTLQKLMSTVATSR